MTLFTRVGTTTKKSTEHDLSRCADRFIREADMTEQDRHLASGSGETLSSSGSETLSEGEEEEEVAAAAAAAALEVKVCGEGEEERNAEEDEDEEEEDEKVHTHVFCAFHGTVGFQVEHLWSFSNTNNRLIK